MDNLSAYNSEKKKHIIRKSAHYFHKNVKLKLFQKQLVIFSKQILNFRAIKLPKNLISFVPRLS